MANLYIKGGNNKTNKMKMKIENKKQGTRSLQLKKKGGLVGCLKGALDLLVTN